MAKQARFTFDPRKKYTKKDRMKAIKFVVGLKHWNLKFTKVKKLK